MFRNPLAQQILKNKDVENALQNLISMGVKRLEEKVFRPKDVDAWLKSMVGAEDFRREVQGICTNAIDDNASAMFSWVEDELEEGQHVLFLFPARIATLAATRTVIKTYSNRQALEQAVEDRDQRILALAGYVSSSFDAMLRQEEITSDEIPEGMSVLFGSHHNSKKVALKFGDINDYFTILLSGPGGADFVYHTVNELKEVVQSWLFEIESSEAKEIGERWKMLVAESSKEAFSFNTFPREPSEVAYVAYSLPVRS